eukprot:CAMPEP_0198146332 /NCGR_PEP_ID=MMETSP1443-20131203/28941_1 /TAXON_ID=186043 /ORGANISM="Entomoneis sp., Strain CCMP2396" /LENGTH=521 /DNA_ID=CAMNT_0043810265 /DNA_START=116 /DNA_END=1681 /DNA_ORIENTATION=+
MAPLSPSAKRGVTPTSVITEMEETLLSLDEYELPPEFTLSTDNLKAKKARVPALIARYEKLREDMLKSNIERGFLEHARSHGLTEAPTCSESSDEELADLQNQREAMAQSLHDIAERMHTQEQHLQADYALLKQRKEDLRQMLNEFQQKCEEGQDERFIPDIENTMLDENEDDEEIVEHDLAEQEQLLRDLERRKMDLYHQLDRLQDEAAEMDIENSCLENDASSTAEIAALEEANNKLQKQLDQLTTIKNDYNYRRLILEELSGIEIESVEEEKVPGRSALIKIYFQLLHEHKLCVTLEHSPQQREFIKGAKFVEKPKSPGKAEDPKYLYMPPLDDLIPVAQHYNAAILLPHNGNGRGGLRFLVHSALARLEIRNDRMAELDLLRESLKCEVRVYQDPSDPEDYLFQRTTCRFAWDKENVDVTAVLRLTPDCPRLPGSIFLEELKCTKHAWAIQLLASQVQGEQSRFSSPIQLITELQQSLALALQQQLPTKANEMTRKEQNQKHDSPLNHDANADMWEC